MENLTREQIMTASVITHMARKQHNREVKVGRLEMQKRIKEQDCYGVQKESEQNDRWRK